MIRKAIVGFVAATTLCVGIAVADESAPANDVVVAQLLGKSITMGDLRAKVASSGGNPAIFTDWGSVLNTVVTTSLMEKSIDQNGLRASEPEIATYVQKLVGSELSKQQSFVKSAADIQAKIDAPSTPGAEREALRQQLKFVDRASKGELWPDAATRQQMVIDAAALRQRLATETLSDADRANLELDLANAERYAGLTEDQAKAVYQQYESQMRRSMAIPVIEWWKFNRALYQRFGGRIVAYPDGPEAFDATKTWLEERQTAGDFTILDQSIRGGFWAYYASTNPPGLIVTPKGTEFTTPWWAQ